MIKVLGSIRQFSKSEDARRFWYFYKEKAGSDLFETIISGSPILKDFEPKCIMLEYVTGTVSQLSLNYHFKSDTFSTDLERFVIKLTFDRYYSGENGSRDFKLSLMISESTEFRKFIESSEPSMLGNLVEIGTEEQGDESDNLKKMMPRINETILKKLDLLKQYKIAKEIFFA